MNATSAKGNNLKMKVLTNLLVNVSFYAINNQNEILSGNPNRFAYK